MISAPIPIPIAMPTIKPQIKDLYGMNIKHFRSLTEYELTPDAPEVVKGRLLEYIYWDILTEPLEASSTSNKKLDLSEKVFSGPVFLLLELDEQRTYLVPLFGKSRVYDILSLIHNFYQLYQTKCKTRSDKTWFQDLTYLSRNIWFVSLES
jgi:hypothetical protein